MVGSAGTCQPAAATRRSQARRRARPAYDAGVHLRPRPAGPRQQTAPRPRAYAGGGPWRRKSAFGSPMTGRRRAADDARPRPPEDAAPAAVGGRFQRMTRITTREYTRRREVPTRTNTTEVGCPLSQPLTDGQARAAPAALGASRGRRRFCRRPCSPHLISRPHSNVSIYPHHIRRRCRQ